MDPILQVDHLHKSFGAIQAVQDVSFQVRPGELFAFLGVNGAGKSTTIAILCGQLAKDAGEVWVDGRDIETDAPAILIGAVAVLMAAYILLCRKKGKERK